jgi:hypothetical protein
MGRAGAGVVVSGREARLQGTGIGPALRKARLLRGKSIQEASRETRIRAEYLQALERERFEVLLGDVYVRGFLRSYSTYLGLDPGKVMTAYRRRFGEGTPGPDGGEVVGRRGPLLADTVRRHPSWAALVAAAVALLGVLGALGLLAGGEPPPPAPPATEAPALQVSPPTVVVGIRARERVPVTVRVDGEPARRFVLRPGELRSFVGTRRIRVELEVGGLAELTVNGRELGAPGRRSAPYARTFDPQDFRRERSERRP